MVGEGVIGSAGGHDMVEHRYPQQASTGNQAFGEPPVLPARLGVATGVVA